MFLDGQNSNAIVRKQVWGLDLRGLGGNATAAGIHGAGGIGGLLACAQPQGEQEISFWYLYDGHGNVAQVLSASSYSVVAHYEYDPYGNAIVATGTYAAANPYRFSTKQWDTNVGLGYWGYRYYNPTTGRWLSRDPIEERGGANLYQYVRCRPLDRLDPTGACTIELRCGNLLGGSGGLVVHCQYEITGSSLGTGTCTCGPGTCINKCRDIMCWPGGCVNCVWASGPPGTWGVVVQTITATEGQCACLRNSCGSYPNYSCYTLGPTNSNTGAACVGRRCDLGARPPVPPPGWDAGSAGVCPPGF